MTRHEFSIDVAGGHLAGWTEGEGIPVLLLHGGPGMSVGYLVDLIAELTENCLVATFQQRGLAPSTATSPYDVTTQIMDVVAVLDHLQWDRALIAGHSWGGHLLLHLLARYPDRVSAACVIDPLGGVGDGGMAAFEAEIARRTPQEDRERADELDRLALAGMSSPEQDDESLRLIWPAYFPDVQGAAPYRSIAMSSQAYGQTYASLIAELPTLADHLRGCPVPTVLLSGQGSPMPLTACTETAELFTDADVEIVEGAGHFIWLDKPGAVSAAIDRLLRRADTS